MKIVELRAENIKRLKAVSIKPDGNLVQITGRNGQGKTSVLDAIWWALEGGRNVQKEPVRKGQKNASIMIDLGDMTVTRTFKKKEADEAEYTTKLEFISKDGVKFKQADLDNLLGKLTFDPLEFTRMKPGEQFDMLKSLVPGVDFDKIEKDNADDFSARTEIGRQIKAKQGQLIGLPIVAAPPKDAVLDETALMDKIEKAAAINSDIEARKNNRAAAEQEVANIDKTIDDLEEQIETLRARQKGLQKKLAEALPLPEPIDTAAIRAQIDQVKTWQTAQRQIDERARLEQEIADLEAQHDGLTRAMKSRDEAKEAAIKAAELPVSGISFGDDQILLDKIPFNQASDAKQLSVSVAIAMAMNPALRVIRVRDGSLLDEFSLKLLSALAAETDYRIWIEQVDSSGKIGIVIEDGMVQG